jgi:hypothetical protein
MAGANAQLQDDRCIRCFRKREPLLNQLHHMIQIRTGSSMSSATTSVRKRRCAPE